MKKVLILCPYTHPSACGIWKRVYDDAKALITEGYDVTVFSSNVLKGTNQKLPSEEVFEGIKIKRFKVWFSLGGTSMFWFFFPAIIKLSPDVIHTHGYRHPHSLFSLLLGKLMLKKVVLTTHGPFEKDRRRSVILKIFDKLYDVFIGWWELKLYNKVIKVGNWETKFLKRLFVSDEKQILIPNGIDSAFINLTPALSMHGEGGRRPGEVLFMGRVDPVKRVEWIQFAAEKLPEYNFKIIGPMQGYKDLKSETKNLKFEFKTYTKEEYINELDKTDIYLFPSIRESFGMTALEAMARGCIVISAKTRGVLEFMKDGENGFLVESEMEMVEKIKYVYENWKNMENIRNNAIKTAKRYTTEETSKHLVKLYESFKK